MSKYSRKSWKERTDDELFIVPKLSLEAAAEQAAMMFPAPQGKERSAILIHRGWECHGIGQWLSPYTKKVCSKDRALMIERRRSTICLLQSVLPNYRTNRPILATEDTRRTALASNARHQIEKKARQLAEKYAKTDRDAQKLLKAIRFFEQCRDGDLPDCGRSNAL